MSGRCPQDGGFIGEAGCTHPNHRHSDLVRGLLEGELREISPGDCDRALTEGFYVDSPEGRRVGFGKALARHLNIDHASQGRDMENRKARLLYAIDAVRRPDKVETAHKGLAGRTAYLKAFDGFGIMAIADSGGNGIEYVFNIIPKRSLKKGLPHQGKP